MEYGIFRQRFIESNCQECTQLCTNRKNIVFDRGDPSDVVFVGEAPGQEEDKTGQAFVGRSGKWLDSFIKDIDVTIRPLITNIVKCRPPNNRPPTGEEIQNCSDKLQMQLRLLEPRLVVLLGATAVNFFFEYLTKVPMRDKVGTCLFHKEYKDTSFYLMYHPAYFLRNGNKLDNVRKQRILELQGILNEKEKT